jgi:hypothetical protein
MDVDPELFSLMTEAGANDIVVISQNDLIRLNVINNGEKQTHWSVESANGMMYIKGERETVYGINKFLLVCNAGSSIILHAIFDPQGRGDEVIKMKAMSLLVNGDSVPVEDRLIDGPVLVHGWINVEFSLNDRLLGAIQNANTVGVAFQYAHDAPVFLGFDGLHFADGSKKLPAFLSVCLKK